MPKSSKKRGLKSEKTVDLSFSLNISKPYKLIILIILILITVLLPLYYIYYSNSVNNVNSFPIDDTWIHLQFAKNLAEYGSFSYFKNEQVTAGSTSPLYTFILAAGFFFTKNEFIIGFTAGIVFFVLAVYFFFRLSAFLFIKENWLAAAAALLLAADKRLDLIAVSGMETTLFIFLLIICYYFYRERNAAGFAVTMGLTLWTRPDAVVFIFAFVIDYMLLSYFRKRSLNENSAAELFDKKNLVKIAVVSGLIIALYFIMNFALSGSLLPNTYNAKLTYYTPEFRSRTDFLTKEVLGYFTEPAYILLIIPFAAGLLKIISDSVKLKYNNYLAPALFIFGMIFVYWLKLPFSHRFGRYLMPLAPFFILLSLYGSRILFTFISRHLTSKKTANALNVIFVIAAIIYFSADYYKYRQVYQVNNRHIYTRYVVTGKWLKDNTPEGTIIAAHDVGAIAFYSERKIIDIVGLINPGFTKKLNDNDYASFVEDEIKKLNVSYLAFVNEWFQVTNQAPVFTAGDNNTDIIEVYRYDPQRTHLLRRDINETIRFAAKLIMQKQYSKANEYLLYALQADTNSAITLFYLGYSSASLGEGASAERYLKSSLLKYPNYRDAVVMLSKLYESQKRIPEAVSLVKSYMKLVPGDTTAAAFLKQLNKMPPQ